MTLSKSKNVWKWTKKAWNCQKSENTISENIFLTFSDIFTLPIFWHFCNLCKFSDIFVPVSWHLCYLWKWSDIFRPILTFFHSQDSDIYTLWIMEDWTKINSLHLLEISDSKRGCVFSMVIWLAFHMGQYRVNDHPYHAPQFTGRLIWQFWIIQILDG